MVIIEDEGNAILSASEPSLRQPSTSGCQPSSSGLSSQQIVLSGASESQQPSFERVAETCEEPCSLEKLIALFKGHLKIDQILQIYRASCDNFEASMDCMLAGPTLTSIISILQKRFEHQSPVKVKLDADDVWQDMILHYKSPTIQVQV